MTQDISYWQKAHTKYSSQEWITKPTIFATQAISYFPKKGKILELGGGQGQDTTYFAQKGYEVVACDLSEFALNIAQEKLPSNLKDKVKFKAIDFSNKLPFEPNSFDIIYSHLALHYFDKKRTEELFDEIYTILRPGGIFATITNTVEDPEISELSKIEDDYYLTPEGISKRYFSVNSMGKITKRFDTLLLDAKGETHKDEIKSLIRYIGKK